MDRDANAEDRIPEAQLQAAAAALGDEIEAALPRWVVASVERIAVAWNGTVDPDLRRAAEVAGAAAGAAVVPPVRSLLALDPDEQRTTPLALLRRATPFPTGVLRSAGVPPLVRDPLAEQRFPDDDYDLTIAAFADLGPAAHALGLAWGAGKAFVHLARRRVDGQR